MANQNDLKPKYGIVAMIDALCVRNSTIEESAHFIENIQKIKNELPAFMADYFDGTPQLKKFECTPPQLTTFGDTFIFSWEMKPEELAEYLPHTGIILSYVVLTGLKLKMAFRGAISVGDYIQSGPIILGPAIADAASWYDSAEMVGVSATPYCGQFLGELNESNGENYFRRYDVQVKGNASKNLWCVPWPALLDMIEITETKGKTRLEIFYKMIQKFSIPKGTEDKYFNTESFVKWIAENEKSETTHPVASENKK